MTIFRFGAILPSSGVMRAGLLSGRDRSARHRCGGAVDVLDVFLENDDLDLAEAEGRSDQYGGWKGEGWLSRRTRRVQAATPPTTISQTPEWVVHAIR
jgi:hypothetical protein